MTPRARSSRTDPAHLADLPERYANAITAVRVVPANPHSATITVVFSELPGIVLMAGAL